ncbi:MAG: 30S ribosomal protein S6 [Omnitrophica WOR_2 bacterium RIFCSPHIGHO2_01_FULL_48_9]|nr:MAG: 30S ribosomal protein S6 [Omnitrophica WOR_2 bacterium RIFCSPHIGHO2_02_FULL_48_11]OGX33771.1 MAG: 30S ribosomal protein S6 [Omnitrophica WOR_2 bacterium RIFCSPHIGHO2_01_FULL_48_9]
MNKYELMVVVNAMISQEEKDAIFKEATEIVTKNEGKVINGQVWLDKHKLTFPLQKSTHGTYYLMNFEGAALTIDKIRQTLKLNERVLRFLLLRSAQ